MPALMRADFTKSEVFRQVGCAIFSGQIAALIVTRNLVRDKRAQPRLCGPFAQLHMRQHYRRTALHCSPQGPVGQCLGFGPRFGCRNARRCGQWRIDIAVLHRFPKRGEHLVIAASLGLDCPRLEHQMPPKAARFDPLILQRGLDRCITRNSIRIIQAGPVY